MHPPKRPANRPPAYRGDRAPERVLETPCVPVSADDLPEPCGCSTGALRDDAAEKTRRRGRPRRREMTLNGLHQKFLRYCEGERAAVPADRGGGLSERFLAVRGGATTRSRDGA